MYACMLYQCSVHEVYDLHVSLVSEFAKDNVCQALLKYVLSIIIIILCLAFIINFPEQRHSLLP